MISSRAAPYGIKKHPQQNAREDITVAEADKNCKSKGKHVLPDTLKPIGYDLLLLIGVIFVGYIFLQCLHRLLEFAQLLDCLWLFRLMIAKH